MRVAFISPTQGLFNRGAENSTHFIANNLVGLGCQVSVHGNGESFFRYKYKYYSYSQRPSNYMGIKNYNLLNKVLNRLYLTKQSFYLVVFLLKSLDDVKGFNPDLVVLPSPECLLFYKLFYRKVKKVVFSRAGIGFHSFDLLKLRPDLFISITPDIYEYKKRVKTGTKLVYIPNGVDLTFFKKSPVKSRQVSKFKIIKKKRPIILCVAAFVPYKRIDKIIEACSYGNYYLIIAGSGPLKSTFIYMCKKLLGDERFHIGTFKKHLMPQLYSIADVTVLPSKSLEAFGNVLVESMACGTPVVANNDPSRKEIVGVGGELTDCSSSKKIYSSVNKVLNKKHGYICIEQASKFDYMYITQKIFSEFDLITNES